MAGRKPAPGLRQRTGSTAKLDHDYEALQGWQIWVALKGPTGLCNRRVTDLCASGHKLQQCCACPT